jgi:subtilase family serine protease
MLQADSSRYFFDWIGNIRVFRVAPKKGSMKTTMRPLSALLIRRLAGALLCSTVLLSGAALHAQNSTVAARITAAVDESSLTTLKGNVSRLAQAQYDHGEASPSMQMDHMRLVLSRSSAQQAALSRYMAELQDKSSPNYHKWLTPAEFGKLYGPADSDIAVLVAWLESHGLTLETVSKGRTSISFSGTVSQVEEAFHTSIHSFQANGSQFYSNTTDPQIPSALAPVVVGVAHLNTIRPRPLFERGNAGKLNSQNGQRMPLTAASANGAMPSLTDTSGGDFLYIVPGDAATIYDTPNTYNAKYSGTNCGSSAGCTGAGVKIGIGGDATIIASIVQTYRTMFLGNSTAPTFNYCTGSSPSSCSTTAGSGYDASDADEAYIDTELAGGLAPGATIDYYASPDLNSAIEAAIDANVVDIFSLSFGECEQDMSTSDNEAISGLWSQAAAQGIAVTVATGDSGSAGCDETTTSHGKNVTDATGGLQVNGYASTPYNIAVGGTDFYPLNNSFSNYVSLSEGSASTYYRTAESYILESTWNDSTTVDGAWTDNVPVTGQAEANIVAGSGGASNCSSNTTVDTSSTVGNCTSGYSKPAWQRGAGVPQDNARDLPDVSLMAGNGYDAAAWLVCDDDPYTYEGQQETLNCATNGSGDFYVDAYGGTSTSTPAFAGILALVQQSIQQSTGCSETACRLGQAATVLYNLYNGNNASQIFHDVTVGNNSVPCTEGTPNCVLNSAGYYFENGYDTTTGYDLATGLGSVDATNLISNWDTANGSATVALSNSGAITVNPGATTGNTSTISVTPSGGFTGTVSLSCAIIPTAANDPATCSIPSSVNIAGTTAVTATLTVSTAAATSALNRAKKLFWPSTGGTALALVFLFGIPKKRRNWLAMLGLLVLFVSVAGAGCGSSISGGGGSSSSNPGTTAGSYTVTVTGVSGSITQTTQVTLNVN